MTIIFTNGCYDILEYHHVEFLRRARLLGDKLIFGLNSDASVRRLKGPDRPVHCEHDRRAILESIRWVDEVHLFDTEDELDALVKRLRPDILVKGEDYRGKPITGSQWAGKVELLPLVTGKSSTGTIEKIRSWPGELPSSAISS